MMRSRLMLAALACSVMTSLYAQDDAGAADAEDAPATNWTEVNLAITDAHVIPSYDAFAAAAETLNAAAAGFCADTSPAAFADLQAEFHTTMDGWQQVQHLQFGPITYFNWNYRIQFWPDDKGTASRQLDALIASKDPATLVPETFARQSVGVQGLQALEILLFDEDALAALLSDPYRCQVMRAITANIAEIANGVATRWVEEFRTTVANADERGFFESAEDATIDFLKALVETVRRLQEQKLVAVLGDSPEAARERRAESWRADRSLRNLKINLASLEQLFSGSEPALSTVLLPADVELADEAFAVVQGALAAQPDSIVVALDDPAGHASLLQLTAAMDALFEQLEAAVKNTDLYLGFNSLDGD